MKQKKILDTSNQLMGENNINREQGSRFERFQTENWLINWYLKPTLAIFQPYHGDPNRENKYIIIIKKKN